MENRSLKISMFIFSLSMFLLSCNNEENDIPGRFSFLNPSETGIDFANQLTDTKDFNILNYLYYYNGGGVAVGDINQDGLPDLYFTANMQSNRLYLNKGNMTFEDITEQAGVGGPVENSWCTGVSMVDLNSDGWLDIYVNYLGKYRDKSGHNLLYINNQDGSFSERSGEYGLDLKGFSTQGYFFDYDRDGDLDLFQLNHSIDPARMVGNANQRLIRDSLSGDKLLRNDNGFFREVSENAGIFSSKLGYGLSAIVGDVNGDNWPDIYVCNDFHEDDYLYINQKNGTFKEELRKHFGHTSRFSMGSDMADINNDGLPDLITLDMKPEREDIQKTAEAPEPFRIFQYKLSFGYYHQYPHNALQINRGEGKFSELAYLYGLDGTDWSWSALFCDLDNDGIKDLHITNGIFRRPNDMDYIKFISDPSIVRQLNDEPSEEDLQFIEKMPQVRIPSYLFKGNGNYAFENLTSLWGLDQAAFSNGAIYSDLDRDGDLDLVVNNINEKAFVYQNNLEPNQSVRIRLHGPQGNIHGIGAKLFVYQNDRQQYFEHQPARGWQSSLEPGIIHVGLGKEALIDSLLLIWPDGKSYTYSSIDPTEEIDVNWKDGIKKEDVKAKEKITMLRKAFLPMGLNPGHREDDFVLFDREPLIPHSLTTAGPRMAIADVNGDGREDLYLCGAGSIFLQKADGNFESKSLQYPENQNLGEEVDAEFLDVDLDGDLDLYIAKGGGKYHENDLRLLDVILLNDGKGDFSPDQSSLPHSLLARHSGAIASVSQNGTYPLVFWGGQMNPGGYGLDPESAVLIHFGDALRNASHKVLPDLNPDPFLKIGMVKDALSGDLNGDGKPDLVVVGEWMKISIFLQEEGGTFKQLDSPSLNKTEGWWNRVHLFDADQDGDLDMVCGNLGLNSVLKASEQEPVKLYLKDFDQNGQIDPILTRYNHGQPYPFASKDEIVGQLASLRRKYERYQDYAGQKIEDIFSEGELDGAKIKQAVQFASVYIENLGDGQFNISELPIEAQFAPVLGIQNWDVNLDGHEDLVLGGNFYEVGPNRGRYDASYGLVLLGDGKGNWEPLSLEESGFIVEGQIRDLQKIRIGTKEVLLVARNHDRLLAFERTED